MIFFNSLNDLFLNLTKTKEIIRNISIFLLLINSIINIYFYSKRNKENKFLNFTYNFLLIIELILVFILFYVDIKINEDLFNELAIDAFLFLLVCLFHDNNFLNKSKKKKLNETENVDNNVEEIKTKITKYKNNLKIIEVNDKKN